LVITPHGEDIHVVPEIGFGQRLDPEQRPKIESALQSADLVTAISRSVEQSLLDACVDSRKIRCVPNGVDVNRFEGLQRLDAREWLGLPPDARIVATIGNFHPRKGQDHLIRAMALVAQREPRARLVVVGIGTERLRPLVEELGLQRSVILAGRVEVPFQGSGTDYEAEDRRDYVAALLRSSEVYVSAGVGEGAEGLSLAVLEALAAGVPVVATAISGNTDIIDDGQNGLLVPPGDPRLLAERILMLITDSELRGRMSEQARCTGRRYGWREIAARYLAVYEEARSIAGRRLAGDGQEA
jgi:glycosyltransferase involved in cell wall biosynthesis